MDAKSDDALAQAIKQGDVRLVQLAMGLCESTVSHLRMAQDIACHKSRLSVCRLLVRRGVSPHEGFPAAIDLASSRGLESEAWSMSAAWYDFLTLTRQDC